MSRSGYCDDYAYDEPQLFNLYRASVDRALGGRRGQQFLRELLEALDAMPEKRLIAHELETPQGEVCAMGAVGQRRGVDMRTLDPEDPRAVAKAFNIAESMAREIAFLNDDISDPEKRWQWMRAWVARQIKETSDEPTK